MTESDFVYLFEDDTKLKILSEFYSLDFFDFVEEEVVGWSPQFLLSSSVIFYIFLNIRRKIKLFSEV